MRHATSALFVMVTVLSPSSCLPADEIVVDGRTVVVRIPPGYDPAVPVPLLLELHGGGGPSSLLGFRLPAQNAGFLYAAPPGSRFPTGLAWHPKFTYCEALRNHPADDSAYLRGVIDSIRARFAVDPLRIFVVGRSAGASMTFRVACDHADVLAAFAFFEAPWPTRDQRAPCEPSAPVHALHITGTTTKNLPAGEIFLPWCPDTLFSHIGAVGMAEEWATYNGCSFETAEGPRLDLSRDVPGNETLVERYGCGRGGAVELWTIVGEGDHSPRFTDAFHTNVIDWFVAHPKVPPVPSFLRGDCNGDGRVDVSDAACALNRLFADAPEPDCLAALNANGDDGVNIADPLALLNFLFGAGPMLPEPFPDCGRGMLPVDEELGCATPPGCP